MKKRTPTQEDVELAWTTCRENRGIMYKTALNYLSDPRWKDDVFHDAVVRLADLERCVAAGTPFSAAERLSALPKPIPKAGGAAAARAAALVLAGTLAVGAVGAAIAPAVRTIAEHHARRPTVTERAARRSPGEYVIPSPGEDYTVTDQARGEKMVYTWFTSPDHEVLVEIAYRLPEDTEAADNVELVTAGDLWGTYCEAENTQLLILRDGDVFLLVEFWGADRDTVLHYAQALAEANACAQEERS